MAFTEPKNIQVETIDLAPDSIVFINGSDTVRDANGNVYEIRNDITDLNVSLSIESAPGTATFTIIIPDHSTRRGPDIRYDQVKLMSEVEIYMKGRFPRIKDDGTTEYPYYPTFWGVIISVTENYNDGTHTIFVSCSDILRWWEIVTVNINPAAVTQLEQDLRDARIVDQITYVEGVENRTVILEDENKSKRLQLTPFTTKFAGMTIGEILVELSKLNVYNLMPLRNALTPEFGKTDKITADIIDLIKDNEDLMEYWRKRFDQIGRSLRIYAAENVKEDNKGVVEFDFNVENFLQVKPYTLQTQAPGSIESELKSKLDIANELKDIIQFEFYMDVNGELIFKPPFYNMNVLDNIPSIIRDVDLISWDFSLNDAEICTRMDVIGTFDQRLDSGENAVRGVWIDYNLAKKYGFRGVQRTAGRLVNTPERCLQYAQAEMARINSLVRQGTITIPGRPELRLGYPIYLSSRDAFYYIKSIDHTFSFGGSFQSTITLLGERRRIRDENGYPIKNAIMRNKTLLKDEKQTIEGDTIIDDDPNYMTKIYDICFSKNKQVPTMIEPNFLQNLDHIGTVALGDWEMIPNVELNVNEYKNQYQITDKDGFELIIPFKYGYKLNYTSVSEVKEQEEDETIKIIAKKARDVDSSPLTLNINPNNIALTLDSEDNSMLYIYDRKSRSKAKMAMDVNALRYKA